MNIKFGGAHIDERGKIAGGKAGDQTGRELCIKNAYIYNGGWDVCIRIRDENKRKKYIDFIKWAVKSKYIGYDQHERLSLYKALKDIDFNYKKLKINVECDCSSLVACGLIVAGFTKLNPSIYTGNLEECIKKYYPNDFRFYDKNFKSGNHTQGMKWWRNGDILLKKGRHVETVISGGRVVKKPQYYEKYNGNTVFIDECFKKIGVPSKYTGSVLNRKIIALANGIPVYTGSAVQNLTLISLAKAGKLKKP